MIYVLGFILSFCLLRLLIALVNCSGRNFLPEQSTNSNPEGLVSILVPARNEETNLPVLINSILGQSYPKLELILYDDESTDNTLEIMKHFAAKDNRIMVLSGKKKPEGWTGKNYACHELSLAASGEFLLFVDADVTLSGNAIQAAIDTMNKGRRELLSIFPMQELRSVSEMLVVPLMNWILLTMLPLFLVRSCRWKAFAAANGQFMLFRSASYKQHFWHEMKKDKPVEDIAIIRNMKKKKYRTRVSVMLGDERVKCRMYDNYYDSLRGFSKNARHFYGGSVLLMGVFLLLYFLPLPFFLFFAAYSEAAVYVILVMLTKILVSRASRQPVLLNLLLHPAQLFSFAILYIQILKNTWTGKSEWKGRKVAC